MSMIPCGKSSSRFARMVSSKPASHPSMRTEVYRQEREKRLTMRDVDAMWKTCHSARIEQPVHRRNLHQSRRKSIIEIQKTQAGDVPSKADAATPDDLGGKLQGNCPSVDLDQQDVGKLARALNAHPCCRKVDDPPDAAADIPIDEHAACIPPIRGALLLSRQLAWDGQPVGHGDVIVCLRGAS